MEDWKDKLVETVRPYLNSAEQLARNRREQMRTWCDYRGILNIKHIYNPQHVVELMELIEKWRSEDTAEQAPAKPTNPFIEVIVHETIRVAKFDYFEIKGFNHEFVNLKITSGTFYPQNLSELAKQLRDLADAHDSIYGDI